METSHDQYIVTGVNWAADFILNLEKDEGILPC